MRDWFERWFTSWRSLATVVLVVVGIWLALWLIMEVVPGPCDKYEGYPAAYEACAGPGDQTKPDRTD